MHSGEISGFLHGCNKQTKDENQIKIEFCRSQPKFFFFFLVFYLIVREFSNVIKNSRKLIENSTEDMNKGTTNEKEKKLKIEI